MRKVYTLGVVLGTFAGLWIMQAQEKQNPNFTGGNVTKLDEGTKATIAHFRFDPGSRTKWHSHESGQIILVEEGVAHTQVKGGPVIELKAGETTYAGPGVVHWHGAAPEGALQAAPARPTVGAKHAEAEPETIIRRLHRVSDDDLAAEVERRRHKAAGEPGPMRVCQHQPDGYALRWKPDP